MTFTSLNPLKSILTLRKRLSCAFILPMSNKADRACCRIISKLDPLFNGSCGLSLLSSALVDESPLESDPDADNEVSCRCSLSSFFGRRCERESAREQEVLEQSGLLSAKVEYLRLLSLIDAIRSLSFSLNSYLFNY